MPHIDLTSCDREPIHIPGSIQPHGVLLVVDTASLRIVQLAGDTRLILDRGVEATAGRTVAEVLGPDAATLVGEARSADKPLLLGNIAVAGRILCLTAHDRQDMRILEIEPSPPDARSAADVLSRVRETAAIFDRAPDVRRLLESAANEARHLTGFDRVMIYRFLGDGSGSVVAEDKTEALAPFLNHRYPASDIPKQARELYLHNLIRVIPDVGYTPAPLVPVLNPANGAPLDMGDCTLRSVSPIHIQYLKNMGVAASMSVSIVVDGNLWGLIAFHHREPKLVSYELREMCKHLGEILSQQVKARDDAAFHREMLRLATAREELLGPMSNAHGDIEQSLLEHVKDVRAAIPADGAAVILDRKVSATGHTPTEAEICELVDWLLGDEESDVFHSNSLVGQFAPAAAYASSASGLLAAVISRRERLVLLWFRAEQLETINWAGNPHKPAQPGADHGTLTPRKSFEIWKETVRNQSERWSAAEVQAARSLGRSLFHLLQQQTLRQLNADLRQALSDKETLLSQKDLLMQEVNHRVQNSLQLVNSMLGLQAREVADERVAAHFSQARHRITAISMVHRRLWRSGHIQTVDFGPYIEELRDGLIESWGREWKDHLQVHGLHVLLPTSTAVILALVLTELLTNAVKYAYGGNPGPIDVRIGRGQSGLRIVVEDQGVGIARDRPSDGFGSRLIRSLVEQLHGELRVRNGAPGTSIILSVPLADQADELAAPAQD
jgi:light-regulated signal transduction histidine kinase (bacteriophytochrome)